MRKTLFCKDFCEWRLEAYYCAKGNDRDLLARTATAARQPSALCRFSAPLSRTGRDYDPAQIHVWAQVDRDAWAQWRLCRPTWVAVIDEAPIGFTDLEPIGYLDMMFVHPAHHGRGAASSLLEAGA